MAGGIPPPVTQDSTPVPVPAAYLESLSYSMKYSPSNPCRCHLFMSVLDILKSLKWHPARVVLRIWGKPDSQIWKVECPYLRNIPRIQVQYAGGWFPNANDDTCAWCYLNFGPLQRYFMTSKMRHVHLLCIHGNIVNLQCDCIPLYIHYFINYIPKRKKLTLVFENSWTVAKVVNASNEVFFILK